MKLPRVRLQHAVAADGSAAAADADRNARGVELSSLKCRGGPIPTAKPTATLAANLPDTDRRDGGISGRVQAPGTEAQEQAERSPGTGWLLTLTCQGPAYPMSDIGLARGGCASPSNPTARRSMTVHEG